MQIFKLVCERDIFSVNNGTKGSTGLDFGTEPPWKWGKDRDRIGHCFIIRLLTTEEQVYK